MNNINANYCSYYQAHVEPKECWYLTGILRSFEHLCFDRTSLRQAQDDRGFNCSLFEFFVPRDMEEPFEEIMHYFERMNIVRDLRKMENRLITDQQL